MEAEELIEVSSAKISAVVFCPITPTGRSLMKISFRPLPHFADLRARLNMRFFVRFLSDISVQFLSRSSSR